MCDVPIREKSVYRWAPAYLFSKTCASPHALCKLHKKNKDVNTFCNDWKFAKYTAALAGRVLASHVFWRTLERIYLNDELWGKKGVCVESLRSRRHGCRSRGWGQQSSGLGSAGSRPGSASELRCLTSSEWLQYSWGQCRLLVAAVSSLGRCCLKLFPSLLACLLRPSGTNVFVAISQTTVFWWFPF